MIIFSILIAVVVLLGALMLWAIYLHAELKGYERGLDEAEEIMREVRNEKVHRC